MENLKSVGFMTNELDRIMADDKIKEMKESTNYRYSDFCIEDTTNGKCVIVYSRQRLDCYGRDVILPKIGDRVLRDGFEFVVSEMAESRDIYKIAVIELRGAGGTVQIGYYDYLTYTKL